MQEFESPGDRAGRGVICIVSQTYSSMPDCVLKRSLVVVFLVFLSIQFSAVHCAVHMQPTHDPDND